MIEPMDSGSPEPEPTDSHTRRTTSNAGNMATDHATDLYVEQEHRTRRERIRRIIADAHTAH